MLTPFADLRASKLAASDGEIGTVREFYFDDCTWRVRYVVVDTGLWWTGRRVLLIPQVLGDVDPRTQTIAVSLTREQVRNAPLHNSARPVSRQHEQALHRHYDWDPSWVVPGAAGGFGLFSSAGMQPPILPATPSAANGTGNGDHISPPVREEIAAQPDGGNDPHLRSSSELRSGYSLHAQDGEIGVVEDFVLDLPAWRVRYFVVRTGVWLFGKEVLLAPDWIDRISARGTEVFVNLPRELIKNAPEFDPDASLSESYEECLHDHYCRKNSWKTADAAGEGQPTP